MVGHRFCDLLDIWWKVFLWGAACNGVIYGIAMIIAIVNLRAHKLARIYAPVLMLVMGLLSTFTVLLLSCRCYNFRSMSPFNEHNFMAFFTYKA